MPLDGSGTFPVGDGLSSRLPKEALQTILRHTDGTIQPAGRVFSVGGSAMHMKKLDGIGREAGIGKT